MEERKYTVPDELRLNSHQQLEKILQHNKDGSYSTQSARVGKIIICHQQQWPIESVIYVGCRKKSISKI
jgi:hypothetical protein